MNLKEFFFAFTTVDTSSRRYFVWLSTNVFILAHFGLFAVLLLLFGTQYIWYVLITSIVMLGSLVVLYVTHSINIVTKVLTLYSIVAIFYVQMLHDIPMLYMLPFFMVIVSISYFLHGSKRGLFLNTIMIVLVLLFVHFQGHFEDVVVSEFAIILYLVVLSFLAMVLYYNERHKERMLFRLLNYQENLEQIVQDEIKANQSMQEALQIRAKKAQLGELLNIIAHQWKQPVSALSAHITNLQFKLAYHQSVDEKYLEAFTQDLALQVQYLSQTVDEFSHFFDPNKPYENIAPHKSVNQALDIVNARIKRLGVAVTNSVDPTLFIYANAHEVMQLFLNVINNALDALEQNRTDNLRINIQSQVRQNKIHICFYDNAGGIPKEHIDKIFTPYFTTKKHLGTGLGLDICQNIMQKHYNGELLLHNSDEGAIFSFVFNVIDSKKE